MALLISTAVLSSGCRAPMPPVTVISDQGVPSDALLQSLAPSPSGAACSPGTESTDFDDERDAVARALAIDPNDPSTLADAAELYLGRLPPSTARSQIGLLYARRGLEQLQRRGSSKTGKGPAKRRRGTPQKTLPQTPEERELLARLLLLEGEALLDLGKAREAKERFDAALSSTHDGKIESQAHYERGVALFELCKLGEARTSLEEWLVHHADDTSDTAAFAHHHLGLVLELLGDAASSVRELKAAQRLRPEHFPDPLPIDLAEFRRIVDQEAQALPSASSADLKFVQLEIADVPELRDLTLEEPPLSPTLLGLFRGLPLGEEPSETRAIVLYRRNLLRVVHSREQLISEVRVTLLHELGHLRGADDDDLRERGLE